VSDVTPKINFKWKRDGKLSKDITCVLAGKSTDGRKNKEPDITVAMFKGGKNLTVYEPNLHRVDVEDVKGLEVVLLLGPAVIKDIYFNTSREMFNIGSPTLTAANARRKNSGPVIGGKTSSPPPAVMSGAIQPSSVAVNKIPASQILPQQNPVTNARPPPADPRTQWEIDAETERLKKIVEREEESAREQYVRSNGVSRRCLMMRRKSARSGMLRSPKRLKGYESNMVLLERVECRQLHRDHNNSNISPNRNSDRNLLNNSIPRPRGR